MMELRGCLLVLLFLQLVSIEPLLSHEHNDAFHRIIDKLKLNNPLQVDDVNSILRVIGIHCSNDSRHKVFDRF